MRAVASFPSPGSPLREEDFACVPHPAARIAAPARPAAANATDARSAMAREDARLRAEAQRERTRSALLLVLPPVLGVRLFVGIWTLVSAASPQLPSPAKTWKSAQ